MHMFLHIYKRCSDDIDNMMCGPMFLMDHYHIYKICSDDIDFGNMTYDLCF